MPPSPSPTHKLLHPPSCASSVLSLPCCASYRIFSSPPVEFFTSFRCLGILLQKVEDKVYVRDKLDLMYKQANIAIPTNRLGLAKGIGLIAAFHLDVVLEKLKEILDNGQSILQRLLSFFTDRTKLENSDDIHAALALMYGYAAKYAPSIVIKAQIDVLVEHSVVWNCIGTKLASGSVDQIARIWLIEPHGHAGSHGSSPEDVSEKRSRNLVSFLFSFATCWCISPHHRLGKCYICGNQP